MIGVADIERALQDELAGDQRDVLVADFMRGYRRRDAHAVKLDGVLVARFDRRQIVGIVALGYFQPPDVVGLVGIGTRDLQRILVALDLEVVVGQIVDRRHIRIECDAVAGHGTIAVGNEPEQPARPDRRGVGQLQPARQDARRLFLIGERRAQRQPDGTAIGLIGSISTRAEQRRRIDAARRKADAVLRIGQKVETTTSDGSASTAP